MEIKLVKACEYLAAHHWYQKRKRKKKRPTAISFPIVVPLCAYCTVPGAFSQIKKLVLFVFFSIRYWSISSYFSFPSKLVLFCSTYPFHQLSPQFAHRSSKLLKAWVHGHVELTRSIAITVTCPCAPSIVSLWFFI